MHRRAPSRHADDTSPAADPSACAACVPTREGGLQAVVMVHHAGHAIKSVAVKSAGRRRGSNGLRGGQSSPRRLL